MSYLPPLTEPLDSAHVTKELHFPLDFDDKMPCTAHDQDYCSPSMVLLLSRSLERPPLAQYYAEDSIVPALTAGLPAASTLYDAIEGMQTGFTSEAQLSLIGFLS